MTYGTSQDPNGPFVQAQKVGYTKDGKAEIQVACEGKSFNIRTHLFADYGSEHDCSRDCRWTAFSLTARGNQAED